MKFILHSFRQTDLLERAFCSIRQFMINKEDWMLCSTQKWLTQLILAWHQQINTYILEVVLYLQ